MTRCTKAGGSARLPRLLVAADRRPATVSIYHIGHPDLQPSALEHRQGSPVKFFFAHVGDAVTLHTEGPINRSYVGIRGRFFPARITFFLTYGKALQ